MSLIERLDQKIEWCAQQSQFNDDVFGEIRQLLTDLRGEIGAAAMNEERDEQARKLDLHERVDLFRTLELPGQPQFTHMGTLYLVDDLWREIQRLREEVKKPRQKMEVKSLEIRDANTFIPVICIRPVPSNEEQRYLLRRDGYRGDDTERCVILIDAQCRGVAYDPYDWVRDRRTKGHAHNYITEHWFELKDGDVIDVEFILGEKPDKKLSERLTVVT